MDEIKLKKIGVIHSEYKSKEGMPIQGIFSHGKGWIELNEEYIDGLKDLDGFSHIILLYHFHKSSGFELLTKPFLDDDRHGVFATRAPKRPNQIGFSIVRLDRIERNMLYINEVDIIDGTPLIDIKPYVSKFDMRDETKCGWFDDTDKKNHLSDGRFG